LEIYCLKTSEQRIFLIFRKLHNKLIFLDHKIPTSPASLIMQQPQQIFSNNSIFWSIKQDTFKSSVQIFSINFCLFKILTNCRKTNSFKFNTPQAVCTKHQARCASIRRANSPENVLKKSAPGILTGPIFDPTQAFSKNLFFGFRFFFVKIILHGC
jgi:hypothetical protein